MPGKRGQPDLQDAVAVVFDSYYRAKTALDLLPVEWEFGEAGKTSTDDRDTTSAGDTRRLPVHFFGHRHAGVVVASQWRAFDDGAPAGVAGHAIANLRLTSRSSLQWPGRIRHQCASERHQFHRAPRQMAFGFGRVGY